MSNKQSEQSSIQQPSGIIEEVMTERKEQIQMVDRKERGNHRANSARKGNTRYGDVEDSMIQFDLTSSKIIENDYEDKKK